MRTVPNDTVPKRDRHIKMIVRTVKGKYRRKISAMAIKAAAFFVVLILLLNVTSIPARSE